MENVNTIELNGQLYDIEDATARTTAEQNSKELVKVKETANNAQTTATTAQASASTAQTTANEAKALATTAQATANEAKASATTKQPIGGQPFSAPVDSGITETIPQNEIENLTNIIPNETDESITATIGIQTSPPDGGKWLGLLLINQEKGTYKINTSWVNSDITIRIENNNILIKNNTANTMYILLCPLGYNTK